MNADEYGRWKSSGPATATPLTRDAIERAAKALLERREWPEVEYHSPRCNVMHGADDCSCGARPLDAFLKAELERR